MTGALAVRFGAIIFDFDGVLIESEYIGNKHIADYLTRIGHPTSVEESMANFMGLAGADFLAAIERWIGPASGRTGFVLTPASEDASFRRYLRLDGAGGSSFGSEDAGCAAAVAVSNNWRRNWRWSGMGAHITVSRRPMARRSPTLAN